MSDKRQRAIAKRAKRKPARDRQKSREKAARRVEAKASRRGMNSGMGGDLAIALALLATLPRKPSIPSQALNTIVVNPKPSREP